MNTKTKLALLIILISFSCQPADSDATKDAGDTKSSPGQGIKSSVVSKESVMGIWTDGSGPNATFIISSDSIEYIDVEGDNLFMYELLQDTIVIHYEDFEFKAKINTGKDTLIFEEGEDITLFTRFKE